jgi:hypothetical protein
MFIEFTRFWGFVFWCMVGATAFLFGGFLSGSFQAIELCIKPHRKQVLPEFAVNDGWMTGLAVPLLSYLIVRIATRKPQRSLNEPF